MQTVVLSIKIGLFCFVYYLTEQMVTVLTQFSFLCLFFFGNKKQQHKNQNFFSHFVTAGYQSISIHGTVMIAHVVRGPNLIGLHFSAVFYIRKKKKVSLWWGLSAHDCTTVINQTWQQ